jgi:hypothetical protein
LRENLRIDGMGQTTGRYFRDKLAMRMRAKSCGIPNPAFCSNDHDINTFADTVEALGFKTAIKSISIWNY